VRPAFLFWVSEDYANSAQSIPQLYSGGLGVPDREVYLKVDEQSDTLRKSYQAHVDKMFQLLGDNLDAAAAHAGTILSMETCLARASSIDPYSGTQKIQLAGLSAIAPSIDWSRYFSGIGLPEPGGLNVSQPTFFKSLARIVETNSLDDWKTYLRWHLINATADKLNREFEQEHFNFYGRIMVGAKEQKPRWKRMVEATDSALGFALGQIYVERAVQPVTTARVKLLVANIRASLRDRISSLEWMGDSTRAEAIRKLDAMVVNIGYPDKWRDYSMLAVDQQSLVLNALQANEFAFQRRLNKIGKPVDRTDWDMTPPTVSAFYTTSLNRIEFPAGILQPPFFDSRADDASNYGAIGTVIGHELTHGFDNSNRQYDADGNWRNWWTAEDEKTFNLRAQLVERQFNEYVPLENLHINGKMTLGENIADLGGLRIAWIAFQRSLSGKPRPIDIDGFTPEQRFFLAYAQIWRSNMRPEAARLWLATNPHSPARQRLLGPLSNMPEFAWAFGCAESNSFLRSESLRVRIW
jgi:putative endopeptidase